MNKVTLNKANLYNCEGFMGEIDLVNKLNTHFKTPKSGMTLDGLTDLEPRVFFMPDNNGDTLFTKKEVEKIIKLLNNFGLTLMNMVSGYKFDRFSGKITQKPNIDWGDEDDDEVSVAPPEIEKAAEIDYEITKDFEPEILNN